MNVVLDNEAEMNLIGLILKGIIESNLENEVLARKVGRLSGDVAVTAGGMKVTLRFNKGELHIARGAPPKVRARISGGMGPFVEFALGRRRVRNIFRGRIKPRGNLFFLLKLLPLFKVASS